MLVEEDGEGEGTSTGSALEINFFFFLEKGKSKKSTVGSLKMHIFCLIIFNLKVVLEPWNGKNAECKSVQILVVTKTRKMILRY